MARAFGEFKAQLRRQGTLIDDLDLVIAATAHRYGLALITHNLSHFQRLTLPTEDWTVI